MANRPSISVMDPQGWALAATINPRSTSGFEGEAMLIHQWPATVKEAVRIQERLRVLVETRWPQPPPVVRTVAGVDVAYAVGSDLVAGAVAVLDARTLDTACRQTLAWTRKYRLPEPVRQADRLSRHTLTDALGSGTGQP